MYPELFRDEVFRIGTPRLWLRWPRMEDVPDIEAFGRLAQVATMLGTWPHPQPDGHVRERIARIREHNAAGTALSYAVTLAGAPTRVIGMVGGTRAAGSTVLEIGYMLAPEHWGRGLITEAVSALCDMVFLASDTTAVRAGAFPHNPASKRVLEKAGFAYLGVGTCHAPARGGNMPAHDFELTRANWRGQRFRRFSTQSGIPSARVA